MVLLKYFSTKFDTAEFFSACFFFLFLFLFLFSIVCLFWFFGLYKSNTERMAIYVAFQKVSALPNGYLWQNKVHDDR